MRARVTPRRLHSRAADRPRAPQRVPPGAGSRGGRAPRSRQRPSRSQPGREDPVPHQAVVAGPRQRGPVVARRYSSSVRRERRGDRAPGCPGRGTSSGSLACASPRFHGQAVWQSSQPNTHRPRRPGHLVRDRAAPLNRPERDAAARVDEPRLRDGAGGAGGEACPQVPQRSGCGGSARGRGRGGPRRAATQLPCAVVMRQPFFPTQPMPARSAQAFSITGPMSPRASARTSGSRAPELGDQRLELLLQRPRGSRGRARSAPPPRARRGGSAPAPS